MGMYNLVGGEIEKENDGLNEAYKELTENKLDNGKLESLKEQLDLITGNENDIYDISGIARDYGNDKDEYKKVLSDYKTKLTNYLNALYSATYTENGEQLTGAQLIYGKAEYYATADGDKPCPTAQDLDMSLFNYYVNIYNQISACGACISISEFNGSLGGDAANDSDFLRDKISSGEFTIELVTTNKNGTIEMTGTSPSSDIPLSYVNATDVDNTRAKKLEAKYEHDLKEINHKDKQLDMSLSKLETQRKALTTEYDSIKKVIDDNIERTFGIFS